MGAAAADEAGLSVAAVARRMGVAPATLRTWDRRYGVGPSEHRAGAHRRYTAADLARLDHMRRLVIAGVPPADAARAALNGVHLAVVPVDASVDDGRDGNGRDGNGRNGGGRVVALPGSGPSARGLARAAQSLDGQACADIVTASCEEHGVVWTWDQVIVPVLIGIGEQWSASGRGVEVEHLLSVAVQDAFGSCVRTSPAPVTSRVVVLACAPGEMHSLPLWAVAAALAERRISARMLGASLPIDALASAVQRLGPAAVFVWAQLPEMADPGVLSALPTMRPATSVLIGGPGWATDLGELPVDVARVTDLSDTVDRIAHAVGV